MKRLWSLIIIGRPMFIKYWLMGIFQTLIWAIVMVFLFLPHTVSAGFAVDVSVSADNYSKVGEEIVFSITVQNISVDPEIRELSVMDNLTGFTLTGLTLGIGETRSFAASHLVTQINIDSGFVVNDITVAGIDTNGVLHSVIVSKSLTALQNPSLKILLQSLSETYDAVGDEIDFIIEVSNTGNVTLSSTSLTVPDVSLPPGSGNIGVLEPGGFREVIGKYTITQQRLDAGSFTVLATAFGIDPGGDTVNATGAAVLTAVIDAKLQLDISLDPVTYNYAGEELDFTFTIGNIGNVTINSLLLAVPGVNITGSNNIGVLSPGQATTVLGSRTITQSDLDSGIFVANATITGLGPGNSTIYLSNSKTANALQNPQITFSIQPSQSTYDINNQVIFTFEVRNSGNVTLTSMILNAPGIDIPGGQENIGTILPGATRFVTGSRVMTQNDIDNGSFSANAGVSGIGPDGVHVGTNGRATLNAILNPILSLSVTASPQTYYNTGDTITIKTIITNSGNTTLYNVLLSVSDLTILPDGQTLVGTILPGQTSQVSLTRVIKQADLDNGVINVAFDGLGRTLLGTEARGSASVVINAIQNRSLNVGVVADKATFYNVGELITFTLTVSNTGNLTLNAITVKDSLTGFQSDITTLSPGTSRVYNQLRYRIKQADIDKGVVSNNALATGISAGGVTVRAESRLTIPVAAQYPKIGLTTDIIQDNYTSAGEPIDFTITVLNLGNVSLSNIMVSDSLTGSSQTLGLLGPGENFSYSSRYFVKQSDLDIGVISNSVTVVAKDPNDQTLTNRSSVSINAIQTPSIILEQRLLSINENSNQTKFDQKGDGLKFSIKVKNNGNVTFFNLLIKDSLTGISETIPVLYPGTQFNIEGTYYVVNKDLDSGYVKNKAFAYSSPENLLLSETELVVEGVQVARLEVRNNLLSINGFQGIKNYTLEGDKLVFESLVRNTGNVSLINIIVRDTLTNFQVEIERLEPGQTRSVYITYTVSQADVDKGYIFGRVFVSGLAPNKQQQFTSEIIYVEAIQSSQLKAEILVTAINNNPALTKYTYPGDSVAFEIKVTNIGNVTLQNIQAENDLTGFNVQIDTLLPGSSRNFSAFYKISSDDVSKGQIYPLVTAGGYDPRNNLVEDKDSVLVSANRFSEITIEKTKVSVNGNKLSQHYSIPGDIITYSIVVKNTGNLPVTNLKVLDPLTGLNDHQTTLALFGQLKYSTAYTVTQNDINNGSVINVAVARGIDPQGRELLSVSTVTVQGAIDAAISITKTADKPFFIGAGDSITYRLLVQNTGNVVLHSAEVSDPVTGFEAFIGDLTPGGSRAFTTGYITNNNDVIKGNIHNFAIVRAWNPAGIEVKDTASVITTLISEAIPDIQLIKQSSPSELAIAGQNLKYLIDVINTSDRLTAMNITISDVLPKGVLFVRASHNGRFDSGTVSWEIARLEPLGRIRLELDVLIKSDVAGGQIIGNKAFARLQQIILSESNTTDILINSRANMTIIKSVDNVSPEVGNEVNFTVSVTNQGPSVATGVSVTDRLPNGFSYINHVSHANYNPITGIWQIGSMEPGQTTTLSISALVNPTGVYNNIAVLSAENFFPQNGIEISSAEAKPIIELKIPEGFSPNGDGINDFFVIRGVESFPDNRLIILNRWGNRVYEATGYRNDWDGTNNASPSYKGSNLPPGIYFYILELTDPSPDGNKVYKGTVFLAR